MSKERGFIMIDLHMHSSFSNDGELTPIALIDKCFAEGITTLSITDHNCVHANQVEHIAKEKGLTYITGIEIDCVYHGVNFHILGYNINYLSNDFEKIEQDIRSQGFKVSLEMLEMTQTLGLHVTENELWNLAKNSYWSETWTGEMFAEILLEKEEYKDHPLLLPYRENQARGDNPYVNFYWDFYAQGKSCYVPISYPPMNQIIDLIHQNNGYAVLAHPGVNLNGKESLLKEIVSLGIDGIEAFSSYHTPAKAYQYYNEAKRYQLFTTCGSDFHGKTKPSIVLGRHGSLLRNHDLIKQIKFLS